MGSAPYVGDRAAGRLCCTWHVTPIYLCMRSPSAKAQLSRVQEYRPFAPAPKPPQRLPGRTSRGFPGGRKSVAISPAPACIVEALEEVPPSAAGSGRRAAADAGFSGTSTPARCSKERPRARFSTRCACPPAAPAALERARLRRSVSCSATVRLILYSETRALRGGVGLAGESLLYLTAINWFGRGRHMTTGFIDASGVDVDREVRLLPRRWVPPPTAVWARDPRIKTSGAGASQAR